jgi:hypothetical protein
MNLSLEGLKDAASNLSLYDIKAGVRKVQNGTEAPTTTLFNILEANRMVCSRDELYRNGG